MSFSELLREDARGVWDKILRHPFVSEMYGGVLPLDKFKFYTRQDYVFLIEFGKSIAAATSKAPEVRDMRQFVEFLHSTMTVEMDALKKLANALGITTAELMEAEPTPTTLAYTRYILGVAYSGSFGEYVACILPCMWSYQVIGEKLRESDRLRSHPTYSRWASTYHSTEYRELVDLLKGQLDRLADTSGEAERSRMRGHFLTCSRYEFMFWDMAYKLEEWPV